MKKIIVKIKSTDDIFTRVGKVCKALKAEGLFEASREVRKAVWESDSYEEAYDIMSKYVEITCNKEFTINSFNLQTREMPLLW